MKEKEIQENMNKSIEATQRNFNTIRTGRANASLLDRVSVEYYGAEPPITSSEAFHLNSTFLIFDSMQSSIFKGRNLCIEDALSLIHI